MRLAVFLLALSCLSCSGPRTLEPIEPPPRPTSAGDGAEESARTDPPGYAGPIASPEARAMLKELEGRSFTDEDGALGGGEWTVGAYSVARYPSETWKEGPHVSLRQGGTSRHLPMEADGDAADLYRRVTGAQPRNLSADMSDAYKAAIGKSAGEE